MSTHSTPSASLTNPFAAWAKGAEAMHDMMTEAMRSTTKTMTGLGTKPVLPGMPDLRGGQKAAMDAMTEMAAPLRAVVGPERLSAEVKREAELAGKLMKWSGEKAAEHVKTVEAEGRTLRTLGEEGVAIGQEAAKASAKLGADVAANAALVEDHAVKAATWSARVARHQADTTVNALHTASKQAQELQQLGIEAMTARLESTLKLQAELATLPAKMLRAAAPKAASAPAAAPADKAEAPSA
ncbi:MAG: hypothetical protein JNM72_16075 [Deltaproteobacteria bacterium]|nr:hypothetical protein [Deltaproteobacteria bacterium]